jgi:hypothetical protein
MDTSGIAGRACDCPVQQVSLVEAGGTARKQNTELRAWLT